MTDLSRKILGSIAQSVLEAAKLKCESRTLRAAMELSIEDNEIILSVPHYWAQWFEGGRGAVFARPGHKLVFYKNPAEDPRLSGGHPVRASDIRRLTKAEFYRDLRAGKLVVVDSVGPAAGHPFFDASLRFKALQLLREAVQDLLAQQVRDVLGDLLDIRITTKL